jgi:DNA cross-link repair 1B protein
MDRNGKIVGGCIAVDLWTKDGLEGKEYTNNSDLDMNPHSSRGGQIRLYFLSHLHADHTVGLNGSWCRGPIYTSPLNVKLAPKLLPNLGMTQNLFVPLELNVPHLISLGDSKNDPKIRVTLIDANHVPGAVMFIFQGYFGNVVYTGDFRYSPVMFDNPVLRQLVTSEDIDKLYLDNTYFFSKCDFSSRSEVVEKIISFIRQYDSHHIYIGARRLGKEHAFIKIALALKEKICVDKDRMKIFQELEFPDVFTTNPDKARIFVVPQNMITKNFLSSENMKRPTIGIWLTGLFYNWNNNPYYNCEVWDLTMFEYSDHSSQPEILDFVKKLKPKKVIPIVGPSRSQNNWLSRRIDFEKQRNDMTTLIPYLSTLPPKHFGYDTPKIIGLPETTAGIDDHSRKRISKSIVKPTPKRVYRGPKGPMYHSSNTTASSSNTYNKDYNSKYNRNRAISIDDNPKNDVTTNLSEEMCGEEQTTENANNIASNYVVNSELDQSSTSSLSSLQESELSSCNEKFLQAETHSINKTYEPYTGVSSDSYIKVVKISKNNKEQICYVNTSPKKHIEYNILQNITPSNESKKLYDSERNRTANGAYNLSEKEDNGMILDTSNLYCSDLHYNSDENNLTPISPPLESAHNQLIELSNNIRDSANTLLTRTFRGCIEKKDCSVLHTIDQNLSKVQNILNK